MLAGASPGVHHQVSAIASAERHIRPTLSAWRATERKNLRRKNLVTNNLLLHSRTARARCGAVSLEKSLPIDVRE
jgi:hypothetical protein